MLPTWCLETCLETTTSWTCTRSWARPSATRIRGRGETWPWNGRACPHYRDDCQGLRRCDPPHARLGPRAQLSLSASGFIVAACFAVLAIVCLVVTTPQTTRDTKPRHSYHPYSGIMRWCLCICLFSCLGSGVALSPVEIHHSGHGSIVLEEQLAISAADFATSMGHLWAARGPANVKNCIFEAKQFVSTSRRDTINFRIFESPLSQLSDAWRSKPNILRYGF